MVSTIENMSQFLPILLELINEGVLITNIEGKLIYVSSSLAKMLKYSQAEIESKENINQILPLLKTNLLEIKRKKVLKNIIFLRENQQGENIYLSINIQYVNNFNEEYLVYTFQDITKEQNLRKEVKLIKKIYADLAENLPLGVFRLDNLGNLIYANTETQRLLGENEHINKPIMSLWLDNIYENDKQLFLDTLSQTLIDGGNSQFCYRYCHPNRKEVLWFETICIKKQIFEQESYIIGTITDITYQKNTTIKLRESEAKYRSIFESAFIGIARVSLTGKLLKVNNKFCQILGYSQEELTQLTFQEITYPEDLEKDLKLLEDFLKGKINTYSLEKRYIKKNGENTWTRLDVSLVKDNENKPKYFISTIQDIDKEKKIEKELKVSEMRFRNAFIYAPFPQMIHAEDGEVIQINQAWSDISGYSHQEIPTITQWAQKAYKEKMLEISNYIEDLYQIKESLDEGEYTIHTVEGKERVWHFHTMPLGLLPDGRKIVLSMAMDITERKEAENSYILLNQELEMRVSQRTKELKSVKDFLSLIIDNIPQKIFWKDRNSVYLGCNRSFANVIGCTDTRGIIGKTDFDLPITPHQSELYREWDRWVMEYDRTRYHVIEKIICDGKEIYTDTCRMPLHNSQGEVMGVLVTYDDITERKQLEENLKLTQFTLDKLGDSVFLVDKFTNFFYTNEAATLTLGYSSAEFKTMQVKNINPLFEKDDNKKWLEIMNTLAEKKQMTIESFHRHKNGTLIPVEVNIYPFNYGEKFYYCAIAKDISERKKNQQALKESEARYRLMANNVTDMISRHSPDGIYLYVSPSVKILLGYQPSELINTLPQHWIYRDDIFLFNQCYQTMVDRNQSITYSYRILNKKGNYIWFETTSKPVIDNSTKKITEIISASRDISKRKEAEFKLKKSLEEKEILLKEIHHRVKNNLYIISSLLNLQATYFEDETIIKAFQNSQNRIQSMAMIHEKLYQSNNFAQLNFGDYLTQLIETLFNSCNPYPQTVKYSLHFDRTPININVENAIPCGLIVNEILTNSFKHAFNQSHQGKIIVRLYQEQNKIIHLVISDNGQGSNQGQKWQYNRSLGVRLINILTEQLGAQLTIETEINKGFSYHLILPPIVLEQNTFSAIPI
ncbi:PAS domain S-box protein [Geminocystis herdmanii]|uniref:PAS domain S-box protein n=1 Tax=Geminocystis herdmanii TaxID=669359 RepID=UPI00034770CC|nr:PAS domain S-box protein [Geminocystis herdmanii]